MSKRRPLKQQYLESWSFPWQEMDVLIGGKSSIDLPQMSVKDWDDATAFVDNYGYQPDQPKDARKIHGVLVESVNFIEQYLLGDERRKSPMPAQISDCDDVRHIILWASGRNGADEVLKGWSCAVLRVVHTIAHIEGVHRRVAIEVARRQIMARFQSYLSEDSEARLWLGKDAERVELHSLEWKSEKARPSMILKLLHKKANVAETIFDLLGVRIVTKRLCDVVMVVKYLRQFYMITFANCNPGRARNNLIDIDTFRRNSSKLHQMLSEEKIGTEEFDALIEQLTIPSAIGGSTMNPHSQSSYKSVQLTCRQLIRNRNPKFGWLDHLQKWQTTHQDPETAKLLEYIQSWPEMDAAQDLAVFFPFEVQIMDAETHRANQYGDASHDRYRESQLRAARRRVLGQIPKLKS